MLQKVCYLRLEHTQLNLFLHEPGKQKVIFKLRTATHVIPFFFKSDNYLLNVTRPQQRGSSHYHRKLLFIIMNLVNNALLNLKVKGSNEMS